MDPQALLRSYLTKLINRYLILVSLSDQRRILSEWQTPNRQAALRIGSFLFRLVNYSFYRTILIELATLMSQKEQRSLVGFLYAGIRYADRAGAKRFDPNTDTHVLLDPAEYRETCVQGLNEIQNHNQTLERIKRFRDKALAHSDAIYFDDPEGFLAKSVVQDGEIRTVLDATGEIIKQQHQALFCGDVVLRVTSVHGADLVLTYLRGFDRVWNDRRLIDECGLRPYVYKLDQYIDGSSLPKQGNDAAAPIP